MTPAIWSVARAELRRAWATVLVVGLLGGLVGATVLGSLTLARRTVTAYDRLGETTGIDDARGFVLRYHQVLDGLLGLPQVTDAWEGRVAIGKDVDSFTFLGIVAGPVEPSPLYRPQVLEGRLPRDDGDPDTVEVALRDDFQREFDVPLGTELDVTFLTEEDYYRFDVGFVGGEPHGPSTTLRVVGTIRLAGGSSNTPPGYAGPELLDAIPEAPIGYAWFVRLRGGGEAYGDFSEQVRTLDDGLRLPPLAKQFNIVDTYDTSEAAVAADHTANLLGRALLAVAAAVGLVGMVGVIQIHLRHHAARAVDAATESALGFSRGQQLLARSVAGGTSAGLAALVTAGGTLIASGFEPLGATRNYEPNPGLAVNVAILAAGVVLTGAVVLGSCMLTSLATVGRRVVRPVRESRISDAMARVGGSPATVLGLRFALESGRSRRSVPVRSTILGVVIGIAGVTSGIVYAASLNRLIDSPSRSGIPFDVSVADVDRDDLGDLVDDPRIGALALGTSTTVRIDGQAAQGHALEPVRGTIEIDLVEGREPRTPDEITLGLRVASLVGKGVGDTVTLVDDQGDEHTLAVVGTGVVPALNGEQLGLNALLTTEALTRVGIADPFPGAIATPAPGTTPEELVELFAAEFEADSERVPVEVANLRELGPLPGTVSALVGAVAIVALANALIVVTRRRRRDLALLRAIGFTGPQTGRAVVVMSLTIAVIGALVGIPLGMALGSSLWRLTAEGAFVSSDALVRADLLGLIVLAAAAVALIASIFPARRAAALPPADFLRAE